jgi:hypothetical protein
VSGRPADADGDSLVRVERPEQSEVDLVAEFLDSGFRASGSKGARIRGSARWRDPVWENDSGVHAVHRHRPAVAGDVPVQLVECRFTALGEKKSDRVGDAVANDDRLFRIGRAGNPDAEPARPTGVLSFLFDAKPPALGVGDVADDDVELRPASLRGVVLERKVADDSVPLTVESDRQLLSDVERSIGVNCEERIERADANGAVLRARIARERDRPDE